MSASPRVARALFLSQVGRYRRRLATVQFVRSISVAFAIALIAGVVAALAGRADQLTSPLAAAVAAIAIVGAAAHSVVHVGSATRSARAIDAALMLQGHVTTAMQFHGEEDPVSLLVVRDATEGLAIGRPAAAFPLQLPRIVPAITLTAAIAGGILTSHALGARPPRAQLAGGNGSLVITGGTPAQVRLAADASPAVASPRLIDSNAPPPAARTPVATSTSVADTAAGAAPDRSTLPGLEAHDGPGTTRVVPGSGGTATTPRVPQTIAGTAPPGSAGLGGSETGPGGVQSGARVRGRTVSSGASSGQSARSAASYRASWSRSQSAVAQERVPAELRDYVRRYFSAIRRQP